MFNKVVVLLVAVGACAALPRPDERLQGYEPQVSYHDQPQYKESAYKQEPAKPYAFDYGVRDDYSGANYGHSETSNGNSVEGSYQVALPDGRIQIVKYVADDENGFQAQVTYEGEARYPDHNPETSYKPEPSYNKPEPYKQPLYKPQPHKPTYKSVPQYHPSETQATYQEASEDVPVYLPEGQEYQ